MSSGETYSTLPKIETPTPTLTNGILVDQIICVYVYLHFD